MRIVYNAEYFLIVTDPIFPDQKPDQSLPDQLADAAEHEEEQGRLIDSLHPEGLARKGEGIQLAACAGWPDLHGHALVLAEDRTTFDIAAGRGNVAATGRRSGKLIRWSVTTSVEHESRRFGVDSRFVSAASENDWVARRRRSTSS